MPPAKKPALFDTPLGAGRSVRVTCSTVHGSGRFFIALYEQTTRVQNVAIPANASAELFVKRCGVPRDVANTIAAKLSLPNVKLILQHLPTCGRALIHTITQLSCLKSLGALNTSHQHDPTLQYFNVGDHDLLLVRWFVRSWCAATSGAM